MEYSSEAPAENSIADALSSLHMITPSPFEILPPDLMWTIIVYAPEKIFLLRKTSSLLLRRVYEYAMRRKTILPCSDIQFYNLSTDGTLTAKIRHYTHNAALLNLWIRLSNSYWRITKSTFYITYFFWSDEQDDSMGDWECLLECAGYRMRQLFFDPLFTKQLSVVSELLRGVQIESMTFSSSDDLSDENVVDLMNAIIAHKVDQLTISVKRVVITDPEKVLLHFSSLLQSLLITQTSFDSQFGKSTHDLFGIRDGNWAGLIMDMFSRKLDKLCIVNSLSSVNDYASWDDSVTTLKKELPLSDKPLWFKTVFKVPDCHSPFKRTYEQNNHMVFVKIPEIPSKDRSATLSVKHISRLTEPFNDSN